MNRFETVCYSTDKEYLETLLSETKAIFTSSAKSKGFNKESDLYSFLANSSVKSGIRLIILDLAGIDNSPQEFISKINTELPEAIKLITGNSEHILKIQQKWDTPGQVQFAKRIYTSDDFKLAIGNARMISTSPDSAKDKQSASFRENKEFNQLDSAKIKAMVEANRTKEKLFSIIGHDLKSPFTAILGIAEILVNDWDELSDSEKLELVKASKTSSENTYKLLENLLDWLRTKKTNSKVEQSSFNVSQLLNSTLKLLKPNANEKNITIENQVGEEINLISDKNMVAAIFRNLISNAIKHIPKGSTMKVWSEANDDCYTFCVEDNGLGVNENYVIDYFSKNQTPSKYDLDRFSGMGLLICKDFANSNNGKIWLESQKGEGSKFFFTVPR